MSEIRTTVEVLLRSVEREVEGHDSFMRQAHQSAWRDLSRLASTRVYSHRSAKIAVNLDWSVAARRLVEISGKTRNFPPKQLKLNAKVSILDETPDSISLMHYPPFFVSYHLCNVFLAMNISAPGSADFGGVCISSDDAPMDMEIDLAAYDYDYAWTSSRDGKWPDIRQVPLEACFDWLAPLEKRVVQVADSDIERLLLSLLRIAQLDSSPDSVIWICSGLEALFPTSVGKAQPQLIAAIGNLLKASADQEKTLRNCLREIYRLRNAFAHGNLPVIHPYSNERIDGRVDNEYGRYVAVHLDGVRLLLACVQQMVLKHV